MHKHTTPERGRASGPGDWRQERFDAEENETRAILHLYDVPTSYGRIGGRLEVLLGYFVQIVHLADPEAVPVSGEVHHDGDPLLLGQRGSVE